jgi:hypothetical protein
MPDFAVSVHRLHALYHADGGTDGSESVVVHGGRRIRYKYCFPLSPRDHYHWQFPVIIPTPFPFRPTRQSHQSAGEGLPIH